MMNLLAFALPLALGAQVPRALAAQSAVSPVSPVRVSLVAPLRLPGRAGPVHGLALHLLYGDDLGLRGVALGLVHRLAGPAAGVQLAGLGTIVDGPVYGLQAAGLFNLLDDELAGLQLAGIVNYGSGAVRGVQAAGAYSIAGPVAGAQLGGLFAAAEGPVRGVQAAGLFAVAQDVRGVQVAGLYSRARRCDGLCAAFGLASTAGGTGLVAGSWVSVKGSHYGVAVGLLSAVGSRTEPAARPPSETARLVGLQVGVGAFASAVDGAQLALRAESGPLRGLQAGVFVAKAESIDGLQLALSVAAQDFRGLQLGLYAVPDGPGSPGRSRGAQLALIGGVGPLDGLQVVPLLAGAAAIRGAQLGGLVGLAGEVTGLQTAAIDATFGTLRGVQLGLINYAGDCRGLQVGIINICKRLTGLQLGALNVAYHNRVPFLPALLVGTGGLPDAR